jgi:hypothetical protein
MAIYTGNPILDPDLLFYHAGASGTEPKGTTGANIVVDYTNKIIFLKPVSGLGTDGVTLKCVYSKLKELWKNDSTLIKFPFPMLPITDEQFELINDWNFDKSGSGSTFTPNLLRTGGWAVKPSAGGTLEEWAGIITLGNLAATTDQVYYAQSSSAMAPTTSFTLTSYVNQAVNTYVSGGPDKRSYLKLFCREYPNKLYASSTLDDIGVTSNMTYQCYRFPLSTATDLKAINSNPTTGVYANMSIKWNTAPVTAQIDAGPARPFMVTIDASGGTAQEVYEFVQYKLRHGVVSDIDTGTGIKYGEVTPDLLKFVGDTLYTIYQTNGASGVWINNISPVDKNSVYFYDNTTTQRAYPYQAVLRLQFGDNVITDATNAKFFVFFSNNYGTTSALIVNDASSTPMSALVSTVPAYATNKYVDLTFDYDGNVQGGRSAGTDAPVTAVCIGLSTSQYVKATGTITKSKSNSISLVSSLERNYQNP